MNRPVYSHTQIGWVILVSVGATLCLMLYLFLSLEDESILLPVALGLATALVLFSSLTVQSDGETLTIKFGPGLVRKKFILSEIVGCRAVRNRWYYGWGIRLTPHGWLFNVSGLDAVEIETKQGKRFRIGTDDPQGLAEFLDKQIRV